MSLNTTSTLSFNTSRDRDSTTCLGSFLQCLSTPSENKFFLKSNLNILDTDILTSEEEIYFFLFHHFLCSWTTLKRLAFSFFPPFLPCPLTSRPFIFQRNISWVCIKYESITNLLVIIYSTISFSD